MVTVLIISLSPLFPGAAEEMFCIAISLHSPLVVSLISVVFIFVSCMLLAIGGTKEIKPQPLCEGNVI